jgi:hypothetical protein
MVQIFHLALLHVAGETDVMTRREQETGAVRFYEGLVEAGLHPDLDRRHLNRPPSTLPSSPPEERVQKLCERAEADLPHFGLARRIIYGSLFLARENPTESLQLPHVAE